MGVQHASVTLSTNELDDVESTQLAAAVVKDGKEEGDEDDDNTPPPAAKAPAVAVNAKGAAAAKTPVAAKAAAATKTATAAKTAAAAMTAAAAKAAAAPQVVDAAKTAAAAKVAAAVGTAAAAKAAAAAKLAAAAKVAAASEMAAATKAAAAAKTAAAPKVAAAAKTAAAAKAAAAKAAAAANVVVSKKAASSGSPVAHKPAAKSAGTITPAATSKAAASTWFHWPSLGHMPWVGEDPVHLWKIGGETNWDQLLGALIISFVLLLVATIAEGSTETGRSMQPASQTQAGARMVEIDVLKFLCMCGVTYYHQFMCSGTMNLLVCAFSLSGFTFVAGMHSKDGGRGIMSAKAIRGCCTLLVGACLFNVVFTSLFGAMYAEGVLKFFNMNPALAPQIHLGVAPFAWYLLAIVVWRALVTPVYNMLAFAGAGEMEACFGIVSLCILARCVMPEVCKQVGSWAVIYYHISFYAPFFAVGLAVKDAQLPTRLRNVCVILAGVFLLSVMASTFTKPTDGPWSQFAHYIAQTTGYNPLTAVKQEFLMDIIVQISMSLSFVVSILEAVRLCSSSLLALGPEPTGNFFKTVATWGSRSFTAYMLNYPLVMVARGSCHHSFVVAGLPVSEIVRIIFAVAVTIFFCSGPVDKILGPLVRPDWLLNTILAPIQGKGSPKTASETRKMIGGDPYQKALQHRVLS